MSKRIFWLGCMAMLFVSGSASAWWNDGWSYRKKITIDASAAGVDVASELAQYPVAVRLHTGNFMFGDVKEDGADLRFVGGDDKTPLKFHIEQFDPLNELAIVWVQIPNAGANAKTDIWMYYGNDAAAPAQEAAASYDAAQLLVLHFAEEQGLPKDQTGYGHHPSKSAAQAGSEGVLGRGVAFGGGDGIAIAAAPSLRMGAKGYTFSAWVKAEGAQSGAVLYAQPGINIALQGSELRVQAGGSTASANLPGGAWHHVAVTAADKLAIYVDGGVAAEVAATPADFGGEATIGARFKGLMDEVQVANIARSADWIKASALGQGAEGKLVAYGEDEQSEGGGTSYFSILLKAVTLDGWVVIGILMVMAGISWAVMVGKAMFVQRTEKANREFLEKFQGLKADMALLDRGAVHDDDDDVADDDAALGAFKHSSLYRIYQVGVRELKHRLDIYREKGMELSLTPQAIDAIRASLDAGMTREMHRLNKQMVLLTIAISGGPFLGLLGTVVGVMITFAAIAAAGDVNVNAIAPGIAAALVATVAGLAVAIPALFGYNYLGTKIKNLATDMHVFNDEFITKLAENYSA